MKIFLYGHDSSVQMTRNFYKSLSIGTKTTSNVLLFLCSLEGGLLKYGSCDGEFSLYGGQ